jgi:hypothetical protein
MYWQDEQGADRRIIALALKHIVAMQQMANR